MKYRDNSARETSYSEFQIRSFQCQSAACTGTLWPWSREPDLW